MVEMLDDGLVEARGAKMVGGLMTSLDNIVKKGVQNAYTR